MPLESPGADGEPPHDCQLCPRLAGYRAELRAAQPQWWNGPVRTWGDPSPWLAIIGLAPGKTGANRTGRPFTGDQSGAFLFDTLLRHGLAEGHYDGSADGDLRLRGAVILNAVRCVPPHNRPLPVEIAACRPFFTSALGRLAGVRIFLALGRIAHDAVLRFAGARPSAYPFAHLAEHLLPGGMFLIDSYHCSRYNQNTKRLTPEMFAQVFERANALRSASYVELP